MNSMGVRLNLVVTAVVAPLLVAVLARDAYGGPLDPPGPPGSTDGVRQPGTPISSLPYTISQPGYYYVTRHLTGAAGQAGITITRSNVTLNLGGFTLPGGATPQDGITAVRPRSIVIRNGAVSGWFNGINLGATYSHIEHVRAMSNADVGIWAGAFSGVTDCVASLNGGTGISLEGGTARNCTVGENVWGIQLLNNSTAEGNRVYHNGATGILAFGDFTPLRNNEVRGHTVDIRVDAQADNTVLLGNLSCTASDLGTNTYVDGNVSWTSPC